MSLLETAQMLNAQEEARKLTEAKRTSEAYQRSQRVELFKRYGTEWFSELSQAISDQTSVFNSTTGDHTKLVKRNQQQQGLDKIIVELMRLTSQSAIVPTCALYRSEPDLQVICELKTSAGTEVLHFDVRPSEKSGTKVVAQIETVKERVVHPEDEGRRPTGDIFVDLRTVKDTVKTEKKLDEYEFADYILDLFVKRACYPKR